MACGFLGLRKRRTVDRMAEGGTVGVGFGGYGVLLEPMLDKAVAEVNPPTVVITN
jgi:hypothetical protein